MVEDSQVDWISVEDELPPQKWQVIVKNGKTIVENVTYHYKKWRHWDRQLHQVTHWKFSADRRPSVPPKEMRAYLRRVQKYKHQMQSRKFTHRPIVGFFFGSEMESQSAESFEKEMEDENRM